ncbi:MAG: FkbM family methyltransferase [Polynucleobacter sp.]|uniref:FkbM family methyltransferase n=1 Tax=Polynucleobacter sp. TaxID=2029855 RepID=UPI00271C2A65|nr:FkbM family methyltransferase [Polynucleobacter sp.]MDO8713789.1 FkbM family methyltransferase [Polynucleobacter sp.]
MLVDQFSTLLTFLADYPQHHARGTSFYNFIEGLTKLAFHEAQSAFELGQKVPVGELGGIALPYEKMGAIDSIDLFGLDELFMFAFYYRNRERYQRVADIGANLGLHSILLSKCGFKVEAYEPDPEHHSKLLRNLKLNSIDSCTVHQAAVSESDGTMQFVRVLGNTTSSHLAGAKANPYGELEHFDVKVQDIRAIAQRVDLFKIDAEGHEAVLLRALPMDVWGRVDAFVEIGTPENAEAVYKHFADSGVGIFSQKRGWARAQTLDDVPTSYKEGGVFVSMKSVMPW